MIASLGHSKEWSEPNIAPSRWQSVRLPVFSSTGFFPVFPVFAS